MKIKNLAIIILMTTFFIILGTKVYAATGTINDKTVNLKVDKGVWDDFLRLCSNSSYDRKTLVTQALYDFMKNHKDLL